MELLRFFKIKDAKRCFVKLFEWCILTQFEKCFVLEVGTAKKILKATMLNGAFSRNLKECFLYGGTAEKI